MTLSLHTKPRRPETVVPSAALLVLQPPNHVFLTPQLLTPGEYRIGSSPDSDIVLSVNGVAAEQALLAVDVTGIRLHAQEGLTWVNDFPVTTATLRRGDRISFGPLTFTLRASTPDDLLAYLPAQPLQPVEVLPQEPITTAQAIQTLDAAISHLDAVQTIAELPPEPIAAIHPDATTAHIPAASPTQEVATDSASSQEDVVVDHVPAEEPVPPITLTTPAIAAEVAAWQAERAAEVEELRVRQTDLAARAAGLEEREARLASWDDRLIRREAILDQRQAELDEQRTALDQREAALTEERLRLERLVETAHAELAAEADKQAAAWSDWESTQRRLSTQLNDEFAALQEVEAACNSAKVQLLADQQAWSETRAAWQTERAEWEARRQEQQQQLTEWEAEAQQLRAELARERSELADQRSELQAEACQRSTAHRELITARQETQRERRLLAEQQSAWIAEREAEWLELRERRRRLDVDVREVEELRQQTQQAWTEAEAARQAALATRSIETVVCVESSPSIEQAAPITVNESDAVPPIAPEPELTVTDDSVVPQPVVLEDLAPIPTSLETEATEPPDWMEPSFDDFVAESTPIVPPWPAETAFDTIAGASLPSEPPVDVLPPDVPFSSIADRFHNAWISQSTDTNETATVAADPVITATDITDSSDSIAEATESSVAAEPAAPKDLHAELAKMFGLPEDFGHHADSADDTTAITEESPPETSFLDEPTPALAEPEAIADDEASDTTNDEDDSWRTQLAQMLTAKETPARPEPVVAAPEPAAIAVTAPAPVTSPPAAPAAPPAEDDSIAAYMQRLLARNRMSSSAAELVPPAEAPAAKMPEASAPANRHDASHDVPAATAESLIAESSVGPLPVPEPRQRVDKDEVRATLQSFREVANLSARSAIAKHSTKTLRGEVTVQAVLAGLAGVAAAAYWMPPLWGGTPQLLPGAGCLIAAGWMGWQIRQSLHRLQTWNPSDRLEISGDPESDSEPSTEPTDDVTAAVIDNRSAQLSADDEFIARNDIIEPTVIDESPLSSDAVGDASRDDVAP